MMNASEQIIENVAVHLIHGIKRLGERSPTPQFKSGERYSEHIAIIAELRSGQGRGSAQLNSRLIKIPESPCLDETSIRGLVTAKDSKKFVVRFDVGGLREERVFFWDEVKASQGEISVGMEVTGETRLFKTPEAEELISPAGRREMWERAGRAAAERSRGTGLNIAREITAEEQAEADAYRCKVIAEEAEEDAEEVART